MHGMGYFFLNVRRFVKLGKAENAGPFSSLRKVGNPKEETMLESRRVVTALLFVFG